jgi:SAM-dependent methyltransferase
MPFDRTLRRLRRDRAVGATPDAGWLRRRMEEDILERLEIVTRTFGEALVLGCGDGWLVRQLAERGVKVWSLDAGSRFASGCGGVQGDEDRLPFADASFDLVVSAGSLDSVNDLPGALTLIRRVLRPDGLFLGAFLGAGSLPRLRRAMLAADDAVGLAASPRLHPQIDVRAAGDLLARAGFALPVADVEGVQARYGSFLTLVEDLRASAATNILLSRSQAPVTRLGLTAAMADFSAATDEDGKTAERFEIIHLSGWAPSPDQPKPAKRGSATASLAAALTRKPGD